MAKMYYEKDCDLNYLPGSAAHPIQCADALSVSLGFGGHNACIALRPVGGRI